MKKNNNHLNDGGKRMKKRKITVIFLIMTAICVSTVFALKNMQDITTNLQLPLIYPSSAEILCNVEQRKVRGITTICHKIHFGP